MKTTKPTSEWELSISQLKNEKEEIQQPSPTNKETDEGKQQPEPFRRQKDSKGDWSRNTIDFFEKLGKVLLAIAAFIYGASHLWHLLADALTGP